MAKSYKDFIANFKGLVPSQLVLLQQIHAMFSDEGKRAKTVTADAATLRNLGFSSDGGTVTPTWHGHLPTKADWLLNTRSSPEFKKALKEFIRKYVSEEAATGFFQYGNGNVTVKSGDKKTIHISASFGTNYTQYSVNWSK